jgi:hypothetical protein
MSDAEACVHTAIHTRDCVRSQRQMISLLLIVSCGPVRGYAGFHCRSARARSGHHDIARPFAGLAWGDVEAKAASAFMVERFVEWTY